MRKHSAAAVAGTEVPVADLRPGHVIGASGARTIVSEGTDHGAYRTFVVRYVNGETRIESWETDSTVLVVGRDRDIWRRSSRLRGRRPACLRVAHRGRAPARPPGPRVSVPRPYPDVVAITLNTGLKPKPGVDEHQDPSERRHIEATGETYDEAYAALTAQIPQGWVAIGVARWPV